jgi:hypothetical protein
MYLSYQHYLNYKNVCCSIQRLDVSAYKIVFQDMFLLQNCILIPLART